MTLADLSVITAEVKVDETDIVNVAMGQPVEVTVDALPGRVFPGTVTEVGDQAILRSTGIATSQSTTGTEEAKDFKVVVTLTNPPAGAAPRAFGHRENYHRAAAERVGDSHSGFGHAHRGIPEGRRLDADGERRIDGRWGNAAAQDPGTQGVFVLRSHGSKLESQFVPVTTGITGTTDIEVTSGLKAGDEIVIGPYKVLRTLKNDVKLKRDNAAATQETESS